MYNCPSSVSRCAWEVVTLLILYDSSESAESIVLEARASPSTSERLETRICHPAIVRCNGAYTDELDFSESDGKVKTRICRLRLEIGARTGGKRSEVWPRQAPSLAWLVTPDLGTLEEVLPTLNRLVCLDQIVQIQDRGVQTGNQPLVTTHSMSHDDQ